MEAFGTERPGNVEVLCHRPYRFSHQMHTARQLKSRGAHCLHDDLSSLSLISAVMFNDCTTFTTLKISMQCQVHRHEVMVASSARHIHAAVAGLRTATSANVCWKNTKGQVQGMLAPSV